MHIQRYPHNFILLPFYVRKYNLYFLSFHTTFMKTFMINSIFLISQEEKQTEKENNFRKVYGAI